MKKLLTSFTTLTLVAGSVTSTTVWINKFVSNSENLKHFEEVNSVKTNRYGLKSAASVEGFYIRFYITPAIYNMLYIAALNAEIYTDPAFHFYQFFLGETGKSPEYGTWSQVITLYDNLIENYNEEYKSYGIDFGQTFKNWLIYNWTSFYKIFLGYDTTTNNWEYYPFHLYKPWSQESLEDYWRAKGVILNIPFSLNKNTHTWGIDQRNLRIYPQLEEIGPILYYYEIALPDRRFEGPQINVISPKPGVRRITVDALRKDDFRILRSFWSDLGIPLSLQSRYYYSYDITKYAHRHVYRKGKGTTKPIFIKFTLLNDRGERVYEEFPITFWLVDK